MPLKPELVKAAFQNAIPRRRDSFALRFKDRLKSVAHEVNFQAKFPADVLLMAINEVEERTILARDRIRELLDSGWVPDTQNGVRSAFLDMFGGFDHWNKDPSSDLYAAVESAFGQVGVHNPGSVVTNVRELGDKQVQISNECMSDLDVYAAKYFDASTIGTPQSARAVFPATVVIQPHWEYDAFICHASEDKTSFVEGLASELQSAGLKIWYDAFTLRVGDGLRERVDDGLKSSKFGIVVLSHAFFQKGWPKLELEGLIAKQTSSGTKVILPVWHGVSADEVSGFSPILAGRVATRSENGIGQVVQDLIEAIRPS